MPAEGQETREGATSGMYALTADHLVLSCPWPHRQEPAAPTRGLRAPGATAARTGATVLTTFPAALALAAAPGGRDVDRPAWAGAYSPPPGRRRGGASRSWGPCDMATRARRSSPEGEPPHGWHMTSEGAEHEGRQGRVRDHRLAVRGRHPRRVDPHGPPRRSRRRRVAHAGPPRGARGPLRDPRGLRRLPPDAGGPGGRRRHDRGAQRPALPDDRGRRRTPASTWSARSLSP